jgi:peptide/nickel transport system substrate-binding protein
MRWSDGEPVTADDFMFWWEDVILNDEITPVKPQEFKPGGQLMDVEAVDDYTIVWQFQEPYWNAHYYWIDLWTRYGLPEHVLKDYHIDYNENAQQMAEERNYDEWWQLFNQVAAMPGNGPEELNQLVPVLTPFKFAREIEGGWYVMERNPYYYQVDTDGNQLPYLDKLIGLPHWNVQDTEIIKAKTVAGELDWENWMGDISIFPILMKNAQQGKYQVWLTKQAYATQAGFYCNMNFTKDEVMGDILRDVRFRQALSLALNRDEMNETLYFGKGRPWQITCAPSAGYFRQEWAEAYADYDVNRANDLLDEMGLEWDANDEYRLRPDGDRLTMEVTVTTTHLPFYMPTTELAVEYWRELGIDANIKPADLSLAYEYASAGNHHVVVGYWQDATHQGLIKYRGDQLRGNWFLAQWAPQWFNYYQSDGEEGLEPPAWYMELLTTLDSIPYLRPDDAEKAAAKVWQIQADQLIGIGTVGHLPAPLMAANGLRNIPGEDYFSVGNVTTMGLRHQRTQEWFWAE